MTEIEIYSECLRLGMTPAGAAGCTANILAESAGRSDNLQDCYNSSFGVSDAEYVRQVDSGVRNFVDSAGFGYCQWTSGNRKKALYDYLKGQGKSIADSAGQFQFMAREMRQSYSFVWNRLISSNDPYDCGYVMCKFFEIPANTEAQSQYRGNQARGIYERCSGITPVDPDDGDDAPVAETFWPPRMLCRGMKGADVTALQALLVAHGYTVNAVNGVFDESTEAAVRKYQAANGLAVDGVVGNNTWRSITAFTAVRR